MPFLEIRGLNVSFGADRSTVHALRNVDLTIERGSIHGVIGESGCGKSITGKTLLGLLPEGSRTAAELCVFDGIPLLDRATELRGRRITLISQDPAAALNPVLTIGRQIDEVQRAAAKPSAKGERRRKARELLVSVGLNDPDRVLRSYPHQLSGGMQQRVVIAQALATGAEFLIADEPTTALDVVLAAQFLSILKSLVAERGLTVMMITHDMDVVVECCDALTVLYAGTTVETGPADAVLRNPHHPYTKGLLNALPDAAPPNQPLVSISGHLPSPRIAIDGCPFAERCPVVLDACGNTPPPLCQDGNSLWHCHLDRAHG